MIVELDFAKLETTCWRALCRHQVSELEMVIAATVIRLSFGIGEPCLRLDHAIELANLTGLSKGKAHDVVKRLVRSRALEVSLDRTIYTFLPPSQSWPWLFAPRVDLRTADELEAGIVWANRGGPRQGEFFAPDVEQEFADALAIERMRAGLIDHHQAASTRGHDFPVTDRLPGAAPASTSRLSSDAAGLARPLGTSAGGGTSSAEDSFTPTQETTRQSLGSLSLAEQAADGSRIGNRVPESGTALLEGFKGSKSSDALSSLKALKAGFPNREPLPPPDPGATEDDLIAWMRIAYGELCGPCFDARQKCRCAKPQMVPVMDKLGGWWRLRIRESRYAALNTCYELHLRLKDPKLKPLRNRGGWARDQYFKIRGEEARG